MTVGRADSAKCHTFDGEHKSRNCAIGGPVPPRASIQTKSSTRGNTGKPVVLNSVNPADGKSGAGDERLHR